MCSCPPQSSSGCCSEAGLWYLFFPLQWRLPDELSAAWQHVCMSVCAATSVMILRVCFAIFCAALQVLCCTASVYHHRGYH